MIEKLWGSELCCECGNEFGFTVLVPVRIKITCPNCGAVQHPCSLCNSSIARCNEGKCTHWIIMSMKEEAERLNDIHDG